MKEFTVKLTNGIAYVYADSFKFVNPSEVEFYKDGGIVTKIINVVSVTEET